MNEGKISVKVSSVGNANNSLAIGRFDNNIFDVYIFEGLKAVGNIEVSNADAIKIRDFLNQKLGQV